jgi:DNA-binding transcriptional LysR family regulator
MVARYDITDLELFLRIAELGNVSRGADRCGLAPSSASLRLKGLEEALGTKLFERQARGVALTRAGTMLVQHARELMERLERMHADLHPFAAGIAPHLTVFANNNAISSHLPVDLARFFRMYPTVRISLEERTSAEVVAAVSGGRADIGIFVLESVPLILEQVPYRQDRLVVLAGPDNPLAGSAATSLADCLGQPFICLQEGAALHTFLVGRAAEHGLSLDIRIQVSGYRSIARLVASGAGIGIVPHSVLEPADIQGLEIIELEDRWAVRDLRMCMRKGLRSTNRIVDDLVRVLTPADGVPAS